MIAALAIAGAGFALGLAGSGHCALMCGPLVMLAQPRAVTSRRLAAHAASYHVGRLLIYAILGALVGATGGVIASQGFGRALAIVAASALVVQAVAQWRWRGAASWPGLTRAIGAAGRLMRRHTIAGPAIFGAMTGLLPCGLIYAALTATLGFGGALSGAAFMLGFGAGSVPMLASIGVSANTLRAGVAARTFRRLAPAGLAIVAVMIVVRAFSPHASHSDATAQHHAHRQ